MRRMFSEHELSSYIQQQMSSGELVIFGKTLQQKEANWTLPITSFPVMGGLTAEVAFARVQQLNQELEIIISVKYSNATASNVTAYGSDDLNVNLPEELASKIYDCAGVSVKETSSNNVYIASSSAYASRSNGKDASQITGAPRLMLFNTSTANRLHVRFSSPTAITIPANGYVIVEGRIQLTLI